MYYLCNPKSNWKIYYFFICMNKFGVFKNVLYREFSIIVAHCMSVFYPPPRTFVDNTEILSVYALCSGGCVSLYVNDTRIWHITSAPWLPSISRFNT